MMHAQPFDLETDGIRERPDGFLFSGERVQPTTDDSSDARTRRPEEHVDADFVALKSGMYGSKPALLFRRTVVSTEVAKGEIAERKLWCFSCTKGFRNRGEILAIENRDQIREDLLVSDGAEIIELLQRKRFFYQCIRLRESLLDFAISGTPFGRVMLERLRAREVDTRFLLDVPTEHPNFSIGGSNFHLEFWNASVNPFPKGRNLPRFSMNQEMSEFMDGDRDRRFGIRDGADLLAVARGGRFLAKCRNENLVRNCIRIGL